MGLAQKKLWARIFCLILISRAELPALLGRLKIAPLLKLGRGQVASPAHCWLRAQKKGSQWSVTVVHFLPWQKLRHTIPAACTLSRVTHWRLIGPRCLMGRRRSWLIYPITLPHLC